MTAKHTAPPYHVDRDANGELALWSAADENLLHGESAIPQEEREATAAFLCRAAKSHAALVSALQSAQTIINGAWPSSGPTIAGIKAEIAATLAEAQKP